MQHQGGVPGIPDESDVNEHYTKSHAAAAAVPIDNHNTMMQHLDDDQTHQSHQSPQSPQSTSIIVMTAGVVFVLATILPLSKVAKLMTRTTKLATSCTPQIETILRTLLFTSLFLGSMHAVNKF
jgi:hypothetical protein